MSVAPGNDQNRLEGQEARMIRNQWYVILEGREIRRGKPFGVVRLGEKLVLWRDDAGALHCVADKCAHRGASLTAGKVVDGLIRCPFHGIRFDGTGTGQLIPANGRGTPVPPNFHIVSYPVHEEQGLVWIYWGDGEPDTLPHFFQDIGPEFSYSRWIDRWECHYTRCIENQLDVAHLPFVHYNTIGRGNATLVDGPRAEWDGNDLYVYVYNAGDNGRTPRKPEETPVPEPRQFHLQLRMPHIWQNWIGERIRILIAFVPVDENNTLLYLRFYQSIVGIPLLRTLFNFVGKLQSIVIVRQDKRVVLTQIPNRSELRMGENLLQADLPILEYRRRRAAMLSHSAH
jgi:phenylpropionate dioxygenase-like ring-hydroxylating dioxygenase large terminal subunit